MAKQTGPVGANASQGARQNVRSGSTGDLGDPTGLSPLYPSNRKSHCFLRMSATGQIQTHAVQ